jgi:acyl-CoA synthetase (NDP forming)
MGKLSSDECRRLFKKYGIPIVDQFFVKDRKGLDKLRLRFPVVMKVESPDIIHKTEAHCVILNIGDRKELAEAWDKIMKNVKAYKRDAKIEGVIVQEQASGYELIIGGKLDEQFGPVVLFGAGGIFTELLKDTSIRICPLTREDAEEMISEVKFSKVLDGFRGEPPIDKAKVISTIMNVCSMMCREHIKELDINPFMASPDGVKAVDVRIIK